MKQIATALLKAQSEMSNPVRGSANPYFKSKYADLNAVREAVIPVLNQNGIVVLQPMVNIDGRNYIKTLFLHESGESLESLTEIIYAKTNDAQAQGSGITYARRYGLQSLACVGADDDDGNKASEVGKKPIPATSQPLTFDYVGVQEIIKEIPTIKELQEYWEANKELQGNPDFKNLINARIRIVTGKQIGRAHV